ncbi:MAG: cation transport ATPase [Psychromonas sp.]|jgi:cation transport ATPase
MAQHPATAQMSKAPIMQLVDKISAVLVPVVLIKALQNSNLNKTYPSINVTKR